MCVDGQGATAATALVERSKDSLRELVLSSHLYEAPVDQIQSPALYGKHLYLQIYLPGHITVV